MNASHREPKKSETVEVRLSHETKAALAAKARAERRTVSDVIRGLIDDYLRRRPFGSQMTKGVALMRLAAIPAALGAIAVVGLTVISPARADDVVLAVSAAIEQAGPGMQIFHPNDGERGRGRIVREFETSVELNVGEALVLCLPRGQSGEMRVVADLRAPCVFDASSGYALLLRVEAVNEGTAYVTMRPVNKGSDIEGEPATAIPIRFGQDAAVLASPAPYSSSARAPDEEVFRLTVGASAGG